MLLSVAAVLTLLSFTHGENPAIQVALTNKGLQYGKHAGTDWVQRTLESVTLPDFSGVIHLSFLFNIQYTLTGTHIKKCDLPEPSVEFYPDSSGFKTSLSGLNVALSGQWRTQASVFRDAGAFDMAVYGVNVISVVELGKDAAGRLSVTSVRCDAQVGHVDVNFYGVHSWMSWIFVKHFRRSIRGDIESRICPNVEESIANLEQYLQAMNVSFDVDQTLGMNLSLTSSPVVNVSSLTLGLKGEFYSIKTHAEPPFEALPFTMPEQQDYMLSVGMSDYTVNSALYGYYSAGLFQALVNDSMIPPGVPLHLNTSLMGPYVPQLPKMFPGLLMNLQVNATQVPLFSFQPDAVNLGIQGAIQAFAIQPNATETPLFTLSVVSNFSSTVCVAGGKVKGSVALDNFTLSLMASEVGTFKTDALENVTRTAVETVLAKVNEELREGFPLPKLRHAQLVNSIVKVKEGFIAFLSDAEVFTDSVFSLLMNRGV